MVSDRPYRKAPGKEYAISELERCAGSQFDPKVVEAFLRIVEPVAQTHQGCVIKMFAQQEMR